MAIRTFQAHCVDSAAIDAAVRDCPFEPGLVLAFGSCERLKELAQSGLQKRFPQAILAGCTTAGEICAQEIFDESVVITFYHFEHTMLRAFSAEFSSVEQSEEIGKKVASELLTPELRHIFVLSDGLNVSGSCLVQGLRSVTPSTVAITGGLAGDGDRFKETSVISNTGVGSRRIVGIGFYGQKLHVGYGSIGGWDPFGTERVITKSDKNVLFELDGAPALPLYKLYLGELADQLPASGLRFPLSIRVPGAHEPLVRTLLSVDESTQSLTFAGDVPQGCPARLMKANVSRLLDGASSAGANSALTLGSCNAQAAILISCVGRRLVLKQRAEDELESVVEQVGGRVCYTGFYSYGEIAPFLKNARCELHNQTMTITVFSEE